MWDGQEMAVIRLLRRPVPKYPSSLPSFLMFEATRLDEGVQRARGDIRNLGDRRLGNLLA